MRQIDILLPLTPKAERPPALEPSTPVLAPIQEKTTLPAPTEELSVSEEERLFCIEFLGEERPVRRCFDCKEPVMSITFHARTCPGFREPSATPLRMLPQSTQAAKIQQVMSEVETNIQRVKQEATVASAPPEEVPAPPTPAPKTVDRNLSFYRWMKKPTPESKGLVPYEPSEEERRRAIPEVASRLWYSAKGAAMIWEMCRADEDPENDWLYQRSTDTTRRYIELLTFCGVEAEKVRAWAREAWRRGKAGYVPWFEWPTEAKTLLAERLGYVLSPGESIGWEPPKRF